MPVIDKDAMRPVTGTSYPAPHDVGMGRYQAWPLSDAAGLTQFGAALEELPPGARASHRHWHEDEDEFLYLLTGELILIEDDGEHVLRAGDSAAWKAGDANGHTVVNRSDAPARFLIVGTRAEQDRCHYTDIDMLYTRDERGSRFTRRDGSAL